MNLYLMTTENLKDPLEDESTLLGLRPDRKESLLRYKFAKDRVLSLAAGRLEKLILEKYKMDVSSVTFGENKKPLVNGLYYNLSHSKEVAIGACSKKPIGCDVEHIREKVPYEIADRFFTKEEKEYIGKDADRFFEIWTMREAYLKMTGEGITVSFADFSIKPDESAKEFRVIRDTKILDYQINTMKYEDYCISVCSEEVGEIRYEFASDC